MDETPAIPRAIQPAPTSPPRIFAAAEDRIADLAAWLIREARFLPGNRELFAALCGRVAAAGVPLDRAALHLRALHPQYRGVSRIWKPDLPLDERYLDHGIERTASYIESPVRIVAEHAQRLEWRLDHRHALPFAVLEELREQGYAHYVIAPVVYASGLVNALSWATRHPGGFAADDLRLFDEVLPVYATVVETKGLRRFVETMLTTYVGSEPARLILDGQVRRGDVSTIAAALMMVDLRDFTLLSDQASPRAVIRMLNEYFDCVFPPVRAQGGEIMEIFGDGVLAIFHQEPSGSAVAACNAALAAATAALAAVAELNRRQPPGTPVLQAGVALHYGTASYGNIGSGERLDFTVIGPDVNLTSRIEGLCRELDRSLIMSEAFAERIERPLWELGHFELRGFAKMQRLFELPPEAG
jgi:adenylate cyclase